MIYLIGGSPRCGKSILSRQMAKKHNLPYLSTDNIRPIIMAYFPEEKWDKHFPFEEMFNVADVDGYYKKHTLEQILNADLKEAQTCWPGIKRLIDHLLVCKMDYIIEGVYLLPKLISEFTDNPNIKAGFLLKLDEAKILDGLKKHKGTDWLLDNIKDKETLKIAAKSIVVYSKYFKKEAEKYNFKYFNTEDNFESELGKVINYFI